MRQKSVRYRSSFGAPGQCGSTRDHESSYYRFIDSADDDLGATGIGVDLTARSDGNTIVVAARGGPGLDRSNRGVPRCAAAELNAFIKRRGRERESKRAGLRRPGHRI